MQPENPHRTASLFCDPALPSALGELLQKRYVPIALLSDNGASRVYLARDHAGERMVALKALAKRGCQDPKQARRFLREAIVAAHLQHPHATPVYEMELGNPEASYYTSRFIEGSQTLRDTLRGLGLEERIFLLQQAARPIALAHKHGIWHRDLKPDNILVARTREAYIMDWELVALQPGRSCTLPLFRASKLAASGALQNLFDHAGEEWSLGTPLFMAPEQLLQDVEKMGAVSDVWAFGVMLYEALTDQHPMLPPMGARTHTITRHILEGSIISPRKLNPSTPELLERLCLQMLTRDPTRRPQNLHLFLHATADYLARRPPMADPACMSREHLDQNHREQKEVIKQLEALPFFEIDARRALRHKLLLLQRAL